MKKYRKMKHIQRLSVCKCLSKIIDRKKRKTTTTRYEMSTENVSKGPITWEKLVHSLNVSKITPLLHLAR